MQDVGFIGLGTMGGPMARNLLKAGYRLTAFDIDDTALASIVAAGAKAASSPLTVATASDVVITMLPDAPDVEAAVLGENGVIHGIRKDAVLIDMSTIDPMTTRRVAAALATKGTSMIDCPVAKTAEHAVTGTLTLMVGGPPDIVERCRTLLSCMGSDFFYCGELGMGETMKLTNNMLASITANGTVEALVTGIKAGLTLETMLEVMRTTMAWNQQLAAMPKKGFLGKFKPGFMIRLAHKDVRLALQLAKAMGVRTPLGAGTLQTLEDAIAAGLGNEDTAAVLKLREDEAGIQVRSRRHD
jgi:4-hydroxybutyrate dehydrogenase/sulfolactaldehyde 3-reductase